MSDMQSIEALAAAFSKAHDELNASVEDLETQLRVLKRSRRARLKRLVEVYSNTRADLKVGIEAAPKLFDKPRTRVMHGIKVGLQKGKGRLEWDDDERVIAKIRQHFTDEIGVLVTTVEKPNKDTLQKLAVEDLKKLGVTVVGANDQVVIKPVAGDIDKLVDALLKDDDDLVEDAA